MIKIVPLYAAVVNLQKTVEYTISISMALISCEGWAWLSHIINGQAIVHMLKPGL